jgi:hypothetical protein
MRERAEKKTILPIQTRLNGFEGGMAPFHILFATNVEPRRSMTFRLSSAFALRDRWPSPVKALAF